MSNSNDEKSDNEIQHPIRQGAILRCVSEAERVEPLLEVVTRYRDIDTGQMEYELSCPSHTGYYQYHQEDVDDLFVDTGLTNDERKPIMDDEIRSAYQELHDHSWTETVSKSLQCPHCRMTIPYPDDDVCEECGSAEYTGIHVPEENDEKAIIVCTRHGTIGEVEAVAK